MERFWQKLASLQLFGASSPVNLQIDGEEVRTAMELLTTLFGSRIGDPSLYLTALTHRSAARDRSLEALAESNQRLEFLGDAVLDLIISEYLYRRFPDSPEGELSSTRSRIVNRKALAGFARTMELGKGLLVGESADEERIRMSEATLADAFEALVGAIYLDRGIDAVQEFVLHHIIERVGFDDLVRDEQNHKSRLIEYTQSNRLPQPQYHVVAVRGAEHEKIFTVEVTCGEQSLGRGEARRKKDAEQLAARQAMEGIEECGEQEQEPDRPEGPGS